jgi:hypothetical protein
VFEALASLQNRTIVSFGDSVERNIVNDVYSICQHLSGIFACAKMPNVAEPGRAVHIFWPSINLNWITISFPGVSFCLNPNPSSTFFLAGLMPVYFHALLGEYELNAIA